MLKGLANLMHDMSVALHSGQPPLYVQMALLTMAFVLLRLYMLLRRRRRAATPPNEWLVGGYLGLLMLLSLGVWGHLKTFYSDYVAYTVRVFTG